MINVGNTIHPSNAFFVAKRRHFSRDPFYPFHRTPYLLPIHRFVELYIYALRPFPQASPFPHPFTFYLSPLPFLHGVSDNPARIRENC